MALLAVPVGVAVAAELGSDGRLKSVDDCPELGAAVAAEGLDSDGLQVFECPTGAELDKTIGILDKLQAQRAALEDRLEERRVTVIDSSGEEGGWAIDGIVGGSEPLAKWRRR